MSTDSNQTDFAAWFKSTFGADFPVDLGSPLVHLRDQIWAANPSEVANVPMTSNCQRPDRNHTLAGFWGHSVNSYAFYLIERHADHQRFFRLQYGGAYGDPQKDAARVLGFLSGYQSFQKRWLARLRSSNLHHEMGASRASVTFENGSLVKLDDPPGADLDGFWSRLEEAIER